MSEGMTPTEVDPKLPLADAIQEIFERRASAGERKIILETYREGFDKLLMTMPQENRDNISIKIQRLLVDVGGMFAEYGSRFMDYMRNILLFPMVHATVDFPKDKYYQMSLAGAKLWGEFALRTTKTATAERMNYRNHFLPTALAGVPMGALVGAMSYGAIKGGEIGGLTAGVAGAGIGAVGGALLSGATSLFYRAKDTLLGPPVLYFSPFGTNNLMSQVGQAAGNMYSGKI